MKGRNYNPNKSQKKSYVGFRTPSWFFNLPGKVIKRSKDFIRPVINPIRERFSWRRQTGVQKLIGEKNRTPRPRPPKKEEKPKE